VLPSQLPSEPRRPTPGLPLTSIGCWAKCLILKADGIMTIHSRSVVPKIIISRAWLVPDGFR